MGITLDSRKSSTVCKFQPCIFIFKDTLQNVHQTNKNCGNLTLSVSDDCPKPMILHHREYHGLRNEYN